MKVSVFLPERFETVEALAVIDVLRRAKIETETISFSEDLYVTSAQKVTVKADYMLDQYDFTNTDLLFIPGGPGHKNYEKCQEVLDVITQFNNKGKRITAICAAPSILGHLGILKGKKATCFPGFEDDLYGAELIPAPTRVVTDGNITTSRGMGTSVDLGLEIVKLLISEEVSNDLAADIQFKL